MPRYRVGTSLISTVKDSEGDPDHLIYANWRGTCPDDEERDEFKVCAECDQLMDDGCSCVRCSWCGFRIAKDLVAVDTVDGDETWHAACLVEAAERNVENGRA